MTTRFISPAAAADVEAIATIDGLSFPSPWPAADYLRDLKNPVARIEVARLAERGQVVAYSHAWSAADEIQILKMATHPDFRRQGHGRALLDRLLAYAGKRNICQIHLELRQSNQAARTLYERLGFQLIGQRLRYYENGEDAWLMAYELIPPP